MANVPIRRQEVPANVLAVVDDILEAFNYACDLGEAAIAKRLLETVEAILARRGARADGSPCSRPGSVSGAYQRLLELDRTDRAGA